MRKIILALLVAASLSAADDNPMEILAAATKAYDAGSYAEATELYRKVAKLVPRSGAAKTHVARALARQGKNDEALAMLEEAASFGVRFDDADPAFASLKSDRRFVRTVAQMRARTAPVVRSEVLYRLEEDLIPENIVFDPKSGAAFVGSMYKAKIIRVDPDGKVSDFISPKRDGLLSVTGMKIDGERRELWAVSGNFSPRPPIENEDPSTRGQSAIFRFNVDTGALIARYLAPKTEPATQFNDLVLAPNGDVFTTAGPSGIWRIPSGAAAVEQWLPDPAAFYNGITIAPDGKTIFGASHFEGVVKIDIATKSRSLIDMPAGVTLGGIDGLYFHDSSFVAVQNGTDPVRVIRAWVDPSVTRVTRFEVLEQGHPESDLPLTGTVAGGHLYYIGRTQIRAFDGEKIWPAEKLKETTILRLPLDPPGPAVVDVAREQASLLEVYRREVRSHFERDANWLADTTGDTFVYAGGGKIDRETPQSVREFFTKYFDGATYHQYGDLEPPIVRVSDDGSMGWVISRVKVRRTQNGQERSFVYAGSMMYEKRDGQWVRVANVSTFEP